MPWSFSSAGSSDASTCSKRSSSSPQFSRKTRLRAPRPSTRSSGRAARARRPPPLRCRRRARCGSRAREDAHGGVEDPLPLLLAPAAASPAARSRAIERSVKCLRIWWAASGAQPPGPRQGSTRGRRAARAACRSGPARRGGALAVEQDRAHPERAGALDVVRVGVADHRRLAPAPRSSAASAASKIERCGLTRPWRSEPTQTSTSSAWCAANSSRSRWPFETSPMRRPWRRSSARAGQRVVVEEEVLVPLPLAHDARRRRCAQHRVAAHAVTISSVNATHSSSSWTSSGCVLQVGDRREPRVLVPRRVERQPVPRPDPP